MPAIPATWEAKAGESLEPWEWRLQLAEVTSLQSSLDDKNETLSQKQKPNKQQQQQKTVFLGGNHMLFNTMSIFECLGIDKSLSSKGNSTN